MGAGCAHRKLPSPDNPDYELKRQEKKTQINADIQKVYFFNTQKENSATDTI